MLSDERPQLWPEIRVLLTAAMVIFTYTIGIGILNGTDLVDFRKMRLLGHVHGGTLGWLTLSVFAASLWLFGSDRPVSDRERRLLRTLVGSAIVAFSVYIYAFSTTYGYLRPVMGTISTVVIAGFFLWVLMRARTAELAVPHWGFLAALGNAIIGGILGTLLGIELASGKNVIPGDGAGAHPAMMVIGFLLPIAMGMAEWAFAFPTPPRATRLGIIQMVFPFSGGLVLMLALLSDVTALAPAAVLLEFGGLGIFIYRMWPSFRALGWRQLTPPVHAVAATIGILAVIALEQYLVIRYKGDFDNVPEHYLLALDHLQFIGAMTNAVLAMLLASTLFRREAGRVEILVFVLVNIGIVGFATGLFLDVTVLKRIFAPIMGTGLLIGLGVYALRLWPVEIRPAEEPRAAAAK